MMDDIDDLKRRLKIAEKKAADKLLRCAECDGIGYYNDTTYDRTGDKTRCYKCYGTGLPEKTIQKILDDAFAPYRK